MDDFDLRNRDNAQRMADDSALRKLTYEWFVLASKYEYSYHFTWMDRPIIQFPQDMIALQEIVWKVKPDLIIETGIARGGSLIFYASMLAMLGKTDGQVIGIDIDIRPHNRMEIEKHPMFKHITLLEGSSTDIAIVAHVRKLVQDKYCVMVVLDSLHTHDHVLTEMQLYSPFVNKGGYLIVLDTIIEDMPKEFSANRPWSKGNNPKTAVWEFLKSNDRFEIDKMLENKLLITVAPDGYLHCIKD